MRKYYLADLAELRGVKPSTLRAYRRRGEAKLPAPDGTDLDAGHARPWWSEATVRPLRAEWGPRHARAARS